jgi:hypothetical protein
MYKTHSNAQYKNKIQNTEPTNDYVNELRMKQNESQVINYTARVSESYRTITHTAPGMKPQIKSPKLIKEILANMNKEVRSKLQNKIKESGNFKYNFMIKVEQPASASLLMGMELLEPKIRGREMSTSGFASLLKVVKIHKKNQRTGKSSKVISRTSIENSGKIKESKIYTRGIFPQLKSSKN